MWGGAGSGEMADSELRRQGSRDLFMFNFLTSDVGLSASVANGYVARLVEEGYDTEEIFLSLSPEELRDDFEWKKGHIKRFEAFREQRGASVPQGGSAPVVTEGAPVDSDPPGVVASTSSPDCQAGVSEPKTAAEPLICPFSAASSEGFTVAYTGHTVVGPPLVEEADSYVKYSFTATSKSTGTIDFSERYSAVLGRHKQLLASEALAEYSPELSFPESRIMPWLPGSEARIEKRANSLRHYLQRLVTEASINTLLQLSTCWGVGYALYAAATAKQNKQSHGVTIDATNLEAAINAKMAEVRDKKRRCVDSGNCHRIAAVSLIGLNVVLPVCNRKADIETVADAVSQLQAFKRQYLDVTGREWQSEAESNNVTADALEISEGQAREEASILTIQQITGICDALMSVEIEGNVLPKYRYASAGSLYPVQVYFSIRHDAIEGLNGGCY